MNRDERRAQVLEAATNVFAAKGYYDATMNEIAKTACVDKPSLYQIFSSKREVYLALLDVHLKVLTHLVTEALSSATDNRERIRALIRGLYRFVDSSDGAYRLVFEPGLANDPVLSARLETFNSAFAGAIERTICGRRSISSVGVTAAQSWTYWPDPNERRVLDWSSRKPGYRGCD